MSTQVYMKVTTILVVVFATNRYVQSNLDIFDGLPVTFDTINENVVFENEKHTRVKRADVSKIRHLYDESRVKEYTEQEKIAIVDKHNDYRSSTKPEASNMEYMIWNEELAYTAGLWASVCFWGHGKTNATTNYTSIGQNLWLGQGRPNGVGAVRAWHDNEINNYLYDQAKCKPNRVCGHYTQVVWAKSSKVGCARAFCAKTINAAGIPDGRTNVWIFNCHYVKAGNYAGTKPFKSGPNCTECPSGSGLCLENACSTPEICSSETCDCRQTCYNCGTKTDDCHCKCKDGWHGDQCADVCEDKDNRCGTSPGWPSPVYCPAHEAIPRNCPLMCGLCTPADPTEACANSTTPAATSAYTESTLKPITTQYEANSTTPDMTSVYTEGITTAISSNTTRYNASTSEPTTETTSGNVFTTNPRTNQATNTFDGIVTDTTSEMPTKYEKPCDGKVCSNGGILDINSCKCACRRDYVGEFCKKLNRQQSKGVKLLLLADINLYSSIEIDLRISVANFLTKHCNRNDKNTRSCCSGNLLKRSTDEKEKIFNFTNYTHVITAMGYPDIESEDSCWTMLLVTVPTRSHLCDGIASVGKRSIDRIPRRMKRKEAETTEVFLDQEILLSVIEDNMKEISSDIGVEIDDIRRGDEGTNGAVDSAPSTGLRPGGVTAIVIVVLLVVIAIAVVIIYLFKTRNKSPTTVVKSPINKSNNHTSDETKEQELELNPTKNGTENP